MGVYPGEREAEAMYGMTSRFFLWLVSCLLLFLPLPADASETIFAENFENGASGWTITTGVWEIGVQWKARERPGGRVIRKSCAANSLLTLAVGGLLLAASSAVPAQSLFLESWSRTAAGSTSLTRFSSVTQGSGACRIARANVARA
jgi:hypothetical protein